MLIEFSVTNYKSFRETASLNMSASKTGGLENNFFESGVKKVPRLLTSSVIYGANASGKSNFINAFFFMRDFVLNSSKKYQEGDTIDVEPFAFDPEKKDTPSEFEIDFIHKGILYEYGFALTKSRVTGEWLFAYPEGRPQKWYERKFLDNESKESWYFGPKLGGDKKIWQTMTRSNALFLSTAVQLNSEQLKPIFEWFSKIEVIPSRTLISPDFTLSKCMSKHKDKIKEFLNSADISIEDIKIETKNFSKEDLPVDIPNDLRELIYGDLKNKQINEIKFMREDNNGNSVVINLRDESEGTQKLFALAGPWLDFLENGAVIVIDELNNSLHPLLVRFLVSLLHNPKINKNNAQLIFSTHDTSILDSDFLRRDQVWFFEKDEKYSSKLYPLSDFQPRKHEAFGKGYLNGRYGAVPFFGELNF